MTVMAIFRDYLKSLTDLGPQTHTPNSWNKNWTYFKTVFTLLNFFFYKGEFNAASGNFCRKIQTFYQP